MAAGASNREVLTMPGRQLRGAVGLALAVGVCLTTLADAAAQERVRWKMHSAFAANLAILGPAGKRVESTVKEISNGTLELRFYEPGALVPGIAYFDPVAQGSLDAAYGTPGFNVGKSPALAFFSSVPFGPGLGEYLGWLYRGGGIDLMDAFYTERGVKPFICGFIPPEASGWFRKPINSVEDLRGLKMRFFGLGARVMEKFGVSTQLLAAGDIYPALELGTIDATEFSMPAMDESLGFHQVAKHYYFPGWHQQATSNEVVVNLKSYEGLSQWHKDVLRATCGYQLVQEFADGEHVQGPAIARMKAKGVTVHTWPDEILAKFDVAWKEVAKEEAAKDAFFKKVYESYSDYREQYKNWRELGYLK
jgi:TRAP-type mannitol/chloroaromatic compound transport system substrate-binding protein